MSGGTLLDRYLGFYLRGRVHDYQSGLGVLELVTARLAKWKTQYFSIGGRLVRADQIGALHHSLLSNVS